VQLKNDKPPLCAVPGRQVCMVMSEVCKITAVSPGCLAISVMIPDNGTASLLRVPMGALLVLPQHELVNSVRSGRKQP